MAASDLLSRFARPAVDDLHPGIRRRWIAGFGDDALAEGVLANPRLRDRVALDICAGAAQPREAELPAEADRPVVALLMAREPQAVATLAGCAWHAPTVLDWITWGSLRSRLPDAPAADVRRAVLAATPERRAAAGAPEGLDAVLDAGRIAAAGRAVLGGWAGSLDADVCARLGLFVELPRRTRSPVAGALLPAVAAALTEDAE